MRTVQTMRLMALAALGLVMVVGPSASMAQEPETNSETKKAGIHHEQWVSIGKDVELGPEDSAQEVVVIGGSAKIHGDVDQDVVIIGGDVELDGHVGGQVVVIMGDAQVHETAKIGGQMVLVGGSSHVSQGGKVEGQIVEVGGGMGPLKFLQMRWLRDWFSQCVMELRPLSFGVGWVWWLAGCFLIVYFLIAAFFPHPVQSCAAQIEARPATTFAAGVLAKLAVPILCLVLPLTVVGLLVVPFLIVAAFLAVLVGKTALMEVVGGKIGGAFGLSTNQRPLAAFLIGAVLITLLYVVPVIGFLTFCVFGCWGMGAGVTAICVALRANRAPKPPEATAAPPPTPSAPLASSPSGPQQSASSAPLASSASIPAPLTPPQALAYPRAGFWERMGAGFLDVMLISLSAALVGPFFCLVSIAYFSGLWAWKGTTMGGIVLNLQVVRQDGQPLTFLTAFVRSLAAMFSALVLFLGFFWIGWDPEKQGWHDKIAGTVVVRLPKAISLVCL